MKYCQKCGNQLMDEAVICPKCGCQCGNINQQYQQNRRREPDEVSVGLCFLSFLIPLFGLIYWGVKNSDTPRKAAACGKTALVTILISVVLYLIIIGISFA